MGGDYILGLMIEDCRLLIDEVFMKKGGHKKLKILQLIFAISACAIALAAFFFGGIILIHLLFWVSLTAITLSIAKEWYYSKKAESQKILN